MFKKMKIPITVFVCYAQPFCCELWADSPIAMYNSKYLHIQHRVCLSVDLLWISRWDIKVISDEDLRGFSKLKMIFSRNVQVTVCYSPHCNETQWWKSQIDYVFLSHSRLHSGVRDKNTVSNRTVPLSGNEAIVTEFLFTYLQARSSSTRHSECFWRWMVNCCRCKERCIK